MSWTLQQYLNSLLFHVLYNINLLTKQWLCLISAQNTKLYYNQELYQISELCHCFQRKENTNQFTSLFNFHRLFLNDSHHLLILCRRLHQLWLKLFQLYLHLCYLGWCKCQLFQTHLHVRQKDYISTEHTTWKDLHIVNHTTNYKVPNKLFSRVLS